MSLRTKCALLILAFELTLAVTLLLTVHYIGAYFENAAGVFAASSSSLARMNRLRTLVRNELTHLLQFVPHPASFTQCQLCRGFAQEIQEAANGVFADLDGAGSSAQAVPLQECLANREKALSGYFAVVDTGSKTARFNPEAHLQLDRLLGKLEGDWLHQAQAAIENPYRVQQKAILILSVNAMVGAVLGVWGLVLIRRWVLAPVQALKRVTDEIGKGNLDHRAPITSNDELGQLSRAVNKMSADLARIERQMIQRERLAAMGELISHVAHNIRNPLAGIRASAEATRRQLSEDSPLRAHQDVIVTAIEKFQRWLRELEQTCSPLEVQAVPSDISKVIDNVVAVFCPMADRRLIKIECRIDPRIGLVCIDARHFEQALAAVVGNAIEVAGDRGRVVIGTEGNGDSSHWTLYVSDTGPGIPAELRDKIFGPSFTTKRSGHGLGLALARKVIEMHGGQITADCPPQGGTVFRITMPVRPGGRLAHG